MTKEFLEHEQDFVPIYRDDCLLENLSKLHYELCDTEFEFYTDLVKDVYEYVYRKENPDISKRSKPGVYFDVEATPYEKALDERAKAYAESLS